MCTKLTVAAFCCATSALLAQDAPKVQEPEYLGIVNVLDSSGALQPLERQRAKHQSKANVFGFIKGTTIIPGAPSPIRFPAGQPLEFVVKLETAGYDPLLIVRLLPLAVAKNGREFVIMKTSAMGFSPRVNDTLIALNIANYGERSYRIVPVDPLPPGEYAIESGNFTFCFGIDLAK